MQQKKLQIQKSVRKCVLSINQQTTIDDDKEKKTKQNTFSVPPPLFPVPSHFTRTELRRKTKQNSVCGLAK